MDKLFFQRTFRTFPNCFTNLRHLFLFVKLFVNFFLRLRKPKVLKQIVNLSLKSFTNLRHLFQFVKLFVKFFFSYYNCCGNMFHLHFKCEGVPQSLSSHTTVALRTQTVSVTIIFKEHISVLTTEYLSFPISVKSFTNLRQIFCSVK